MSAVSHNTLPDDWEAVIGLEVHVELATQTKMFSACPNAFGGAPNTRVTEVDLGLPGTLPVVNGKAVEHAITFGLALGCDIAPVSRFHRKNYFYPDMPKNYQISQFDVPICADGTLEVKLGDGSTHTVGVTRIHMEEDTGKSTHVGESGRIHGAEYSLVDYNRAGVPLLECVSEPDIRNAEQAQAYLAELRAIVLALGISDAKLEEGSMRCDANVSVHKIGTPFGTRAEIKNLNSIRSLGRAIEYEIARQYDELEAGGTIVQETRHWDEASGQTSTMRRKEGEDDYRYFPDPDLVEVAPDPAWIDELRAALPELPAQTRQRLIDQGLSAYDAKLLYDGGLVPLFDETVAEGADPAMASKWLGNDVSSWQNEHSTPAREAISGVYLAELLGLIADGTLSKGGARAVLVDMLDGKGKPSELAKNHAQISDTGAVESLVDKAIAENPKDAQAVRDGNKKAIGALVGAVMRESKGKANPGMVNKLLAEKLSG